MKTRFTVEIHRPAETLEALVERYDVAGPRYTSYPTVPAWSTEFGEAEHRAALAALGRDGRDRALYVHVPFCEKRCAFCGCNVVITKTKERADGYLDVLEKEARLVADAIGTRGPLDAMHWGGGTPTFLTCEQLERLHGIADAAFGFTPDAALSVEIDPRVTSVEQLATLRKLGFSRLSMGVQDFDPLVQDAIGRVQPIAKTSELMRAARDLGFTGVNFDLIYGLPHQTPERWAETIDNAISFGPDRLATYAFAYLPRMKPHQKRLPNADIPAGAAKLGLYLSARERFEKAGYVAVGMDHFARADDPLAVAARSKTLYRNFQGYTTDPPGALIGIGVTAISDVGGAFVQSSPKMSEYTAKVEAGSLPTIRGMFRSEDDERRRAIILDLMCNFSVDLGSKAAFEAEIDALTPLAEDGLVQVDGPKIVVTERGRPFVRNIAMPFDAYRDTGAQYSRTV